MFGKFTYPFGFIMWCCQGEEIENEKERERARIMMNLVNEQIILQQIDAEFVVYLDEEDHFSCEVLRLIMRHITHLAHRTAEHRIRDNLMAYEMPAATRHLISHPTNAIELQIICLAIFHPLLAF